MLPYNYVNKIWSRSKSRAKKSGIAFTITLIDVENLGVPISCPILGISLILDHSHKQSDGSISIDRIDSTRGYEVDNIRLISWRANFLKNNATLDEMMLLGDWAKEQRDNPDDHCELREATY